MGTPKPTAPDHMFALSVGANTIRPCAQKNLQPLPRVLYVAENTRRATKDVLHTQIYSKHGVKPSFKPHNHHSDFYPSSKHQRRQSIPPSTLQAAPRPSN